MNSIKQVLEISKTKNKTGHKHKQFVEKRNANGLSFVKMLKFTITKEIKTYTRTKKNHHWVGEEATHILVRQYKEV